MVFELGNEPLSDPIPAELRRFLWDGGPDNHPKALDRAVVGLDTNRYETTFFEMLILHKSYKMLREQPNNKHGITDMNRTLGLRIFTHVGRTLVLTAALAGSWAQAAALSAEEVRTLTFMREEEKLARDVYLTLNETRPQPVFTNIAQSEQQHMDAMLALLERHQLTDPALPAVGMFGDPKLQALYDELVVRGQQSATEALYVGAAIEEIDILDLEKAIAETDQPDLRRSYENLLAGSGNHLRAFVRNIEAQGLVYRPQHLSAEHLETILATPTQRPDQGGRGHGGGRWR